MTNRVIEYEELCDVLYNETKRWNDYQTTHEVDDVRPWLPPCLALLWCTGGRISEVLALRGIDFKNIDVDGHQVVVVSLMNLKQRKDKNAIKESMVVPEQIPAVWSYVEQHLLTLDPPSQLLFHRSRKTVWHHCNRIFDMGTHRCGRHSWTMRHASLGTPILDVKQMGGWKDLESMNNYISKFDRRDLAKRLVKRSDISGI